MGEQLLFKENREMPLAPKVFDMLVVLPRKLRPRGVDGAGLAECFVKKRNLAQNISILRKALSEGKESDHYIQTVPKQVIVLSPTSHRRAITKRL